MAFFADAANQPVEFLPNSPEDRFGVPIAEFEYCFRRIDAAWQVGYLLTIDATVRVVPTMLAAT